MDSRFSALRDYVDVRLKEQTQRVNRIDYYGSARWRLQDDADSTIVNPNASHPLMEREK